MKRFGIFPNAYYNHLKDKKAGYRRDKAKIISGITEIYHERKGIPGYRLMAALLKSKGIRQFTVDYPDKFWCTDFTYIPLSDSRMRYNCTILDLYDRSVIASVHGRNITAELGKKALKAAISQHPWVLTNGVILHSDRGSQYTSKEFTDYCSAHNLTQSMSRAGCPYDNAPMERYFNTLKSELIYQHSYTSDNKLFSDIDDYVLLWYNSVRPHSFNNGLTPWQKRLA